MKKITAVIIGAAIALLVLGSCSYLPFGYYARVVKTSGKISVNGKLGSKGMNLEPGDVIMTEDKKTAYADIKFANGTYLRVRRAKAVLPEDKTLNSVVLRAGKIFVAITKKPQGAQPLSIRTPTSIAAVRGTKFMMEERPNASYICVCEGAVSAYLNNAPTDKKTVRADYDLWLRPGKKLRDPVKSPDMVKMTSAEFKSMGFEVK